MHSSAAFSQGGFYLALTRNVYGSLSHGRWMPVQLQSGGGPSYEMARCLLLWGEKHRRRRLQKVRFLEREIYLFQM